MRKVFSVILVLIISLVPVLSIAADYTALSDEELLNELNQIRAEITKRTLNSDKVVIDSDGVIVSLRENGIELIEEFDKTFSLVFNGVSVNNSDVAIAVSVDKIAINGWECNVMSSFSLDPGKKAMKKFGVKDIFSKVDFSSIEEIEDIEFYYHTYDPETYKTITDNLRKKVVVK